MREERFAGASSAAYPGISAGGASRGRAIRESVFFGGGKEAESEAKKATRFRVGEGRVAWSCRA